MRADQSQSPDDGQQQASVELDSKFSREDSRPERSPALNSDLENRASVDTNDLSTLEITPKQEFMRSKFESPESAGKRQFFLDKIDYNSDKKGKNSFQDRKKIFKPFRNATGQLGDQDYPIGEFTPVREKSKYSNEQLSPTNAKSKDSLRSKKAEGSCDDNDSPPSNGRNYRKSSQNVQGSQNCKSCKEGSEIPRSGFKKLILGQMTESKRQLLVDMKDSPGSPTIQIQNNLVILENKFTGMKMESENNQKSENNNNS